MFDFIKHSHCCLMGKLVRSFEKNKLRSFWKLLLGPRSFFFAFSALEENVISRYKLSFITLWLTAVRQNLRHKSTQHHLAEWQPLPCLSLGAVINHFFLRMLCWVRCFSDINNIYEGKGHILSITARLVVNTHFQRNHLHYSCPYPFFTSHRELVRWNLFLRSWDFLLFLLSEEMMSKRVGVLFVQVYIHTMYRWTTHKCYPVLFLLLGYQPFTYLISKSWSSWS